MKWIWRWALCLCTLAGVCSANAGSLHEKQLKKLIAEALSTKIANQSGWRKLVHYGRDEDNPNGLQSAVHSQEFFLSKHGRFNPEDELVATLRAFAKESGQDPNTHAQCIFPGRYLWLSSVLDLNGACLPVVKCDLFEKWSRGGAIYSVSVLFATGYLGNPASYYGHTLIKFNSSSEIQSDLLDVSVNYGAIVPPNEDPFSYMLKGAFGGYDGGFSHIQFYFHNHNYGELELRDVWEYELKLNRFQVALIVAHSWELLGKKFTYHFFKRNCAYRVAEIIELIDGVDVIPREMPWTFPQTFMMRLNDQQVNDHPLVSQIRYHPSRQTRLYNKFDYLNNQEKQTLAQIIEDIDLLDGESFMQHDDTSKLKIIEVLQDYYQFRSDPKDVKEGSVNPVKVNYDRVLAERFNLPVGKVFKETYLSSPPHKSRRPSAIRMGVVDNEQHTGLSIKIRPSYYDSLDADVGHVAYSSLVMFDTKLTYLENSLRLRYMDIMKVESVNSAKTGLPGDSGRAWKIRMGLVQQNLTCDRCVVARFDGDVGMARSIGDERAVMGGYLGAALQNNRNGDGSLFAKSTLFLNVNLSQHLRMKFEAENRSHFDSDEGIETVLSLEGRWKFSNNWDARILAEKNKGEELSLSLGYYW